MTKHRASHLVLVILSLAATSCRAEGQDALSNIPVKEVTVFKDGHSFILHEGKMPVDESGNVVMDYLPTPVLGTFWPYSTEENTKLTSVVAGRQIVAITRTTLDLQELLKANVGAKVAITENGHKKYVATIVAVPTRSSHELETTSPPNSNPSLPQEGKVILLKITEGVKAVRLKNITDVTFLENYKTIRSTEEFRNVLTLKLNRKEGEMRKSAKVGIVYLQKGLRWIPNYKVTIDGRGKAAIELQSTLINDLTDLEDVTVHLVIGVPTFAFADMVDPISLQQVAAEVSRGVRRRDRTAQSFSNAIMTQIRSDREGISRRAPGEAPRVIGAESSEDLFVFTVEHVTLKKGQRMVLPVKRFELPYKDVYTLKLLFNPPPEVWQRFNSEQLRELSRSTSSPKVMHKIRIENTSDVPLTTAPALILLGDRVLGQGLMKYTSIDGKVDLIITQAVDIKPKKTEKETKRDPQAVKWRNDYYGRIDLAGKITITNYRDKVVDLEVTRYVLGNVDECDKDGKTEMTNILEDPAFMSGSDWPRWWQWHGWPHWWYRFNGMGRVEWKVRLEPGKSIDLNYTWHYFWR